MFTSQEGRVIMASAVEKRTEVTLEVGLEGSIRGLGEAGRTHLPDGTARTATHGRQGQCGTPGTQLLGRLRRHSTVRGRPGHLSKTWSQNRMKNGWGCISALSGFNP